MYASRLLLPIDLETIATFPQNEDELFFMFPSATFPLTIDQLEAGAKKRLKSTVVLHNEIVVAYANFYDHEGDYCWIGNVIVSLDYRGKGAAKYLLETMTNKAKNELNVKILRLCCHNTNTRGVFFYTKLGFKPFAISKLEKPSGELIAGIRMEKEL
jgi:ribosomal protein S18 acetylase RimI-like enzyme